jgi:hypothetical protein
LPPPYSKITIFSRNAQRVTETVSAGKAIGADHRPATALSGKTTFHGCSRYLVILNSRGV